MAELAVLPANCATPPSPRAASPTSSSARGELDEALRIRREEELPSSSASATFAPVAVTKGQIADILVSPRRAGRGDYASAARRSCRSSNASATSAASAGHQGQDRRHLSRPAAERRGVAHPPGGAGNRTTSASAMSVRSPWHTERLLTFCGPVVGSTGHCDCCGRKHSPEQQSNRQGTLPYRKVRSGDPDRLREARRGAHALVRDVALPKCGAGSDVKLSAGRLRGRIADILEAELAERRSSAHPQGGSAASVFERFNDVRAIAVTKGDRRPHRGPRRLDEALRIRRRMCCRSSCGSAMSGRLQSRRAGSPTSSSTSVSSMKPESCRRSGWRMNRDDRFLSGIAGVLLLGPGTDRLAEDKRPDALHRLARRNEPRLQLDRTDRYRRDRCGVAGGCSLRRSAEQGPRGAAPQRRRVSTARTVGQADQVEIIGQLEVGGDTA